MKYDFKKIEKKWQKKWLEEKVFKASDKPLRQAQGKPKYYQLETFPYPSAAGLHVGHPKGYIAEDIHARFMRMNGKEVLYTMGWDAFGLPTENYAIKVGKSPQEVATENIKNFKRQLQMFGFSYDWDREINTSSPEYYKWTQWLFVQLYKKGLAYKKKATVNWCPSDQTVLANEQVVDGKCERCGAQTEQREMEQWFLRITDYAERLLNDLEGPSPVRGPACRQAGAMNSQRVSASNGVDWPEASVKRQKDWIGKSEGAEIEFPIVFGKDKPNFLILHGWTGKASKNFIPWLKAELEKSGFKVQAPELPNTDNPKEDEQVGHVLKNCAINENTIIVGHSLGAIVAMKALLAHKKPVQGLVLVAPAVDPTFSKVDNEDRPFWETFKWDFDYDEIKKLAPSRTILSDLQEGQRVAYLEFLQKKLEAELISGTAAREHFCATEEPIILENILPRIKVFTTRPDTLFGATYMVLAPEHKLVSSIKYQVSNWDEVQKYIEATKHKTELQRMIDVKDPPSHEVSDGRGKTGVELKGVKAINPATKEEIPVWIADYVLASYGTGAIMAVPAHDERDFEFAKKFGLEMRTVIRKSKNTIIKYVVRSLISDWEKIVNSKPYRYTVTKDFVEFSIDDKDLDAFIKTGKEILKKGPYYFSVRGKSKLIVYGDATFDIFQKGEDENAKKYGRKLSIPENELDWSNATTEEGALINSDKFDEMDSEKAKWEITKFVGGERKVQYRLRDWSVSRQRYWGVPIPMIYCAKCGIVPVPEKDLPVKLPLLENYRPKGVPPLASSKEFIGVRCPQCGGEAKRDSETLDTFVDSSWYFLRYTDPGNEKEIFDKEKAKKWLPVDLYVIGAEHTTLHLLYARFIYKFLYDSGYINFSAEGGSASGGKEPFLKLRHQGLILGADGQKMSKSKGNVVNPDELVGEFGADTVRLYEMFMGPFEQGQPWDPKGVLGANRFLGRFWACANAIISSAGYSNGTPTSGELRSSLHKTIKKITEDIPAFKFNTAISALMIFLNEAASGSGDGEEVRYKHLDSENIESLVKLLHPFAPHMAQELWSLLGNNGYLDFEPWPRYDENLIKEQKITLVVQINGKVRDSIEADAGITEDEARRIALTSEKVRKYLGDKEPKKMIYIAGKLVNIVF